MKKVQPQSWVTLITIKVLTRYVYNILKETNLIPTGLSCWVFYRWS